MLKIRMQRTGRTNAPSFRIVVLEHTRSPKAGNFLEKLGTYNPKTKVRILNAERIKYWISVGAQLSATVHNMLISAGIIEGKKINVLPAYRAPAEAAAEAKEGQAVDSAQDAAASKEEVPAPELNDDVKAAAEMVAEAAGEKKE